MERNGEINKSLLKECIQQVINYKLKPLYDLQTF